MRQKLLNWWQRFVAIHICCDSPEDEERRIALAHEEKLSQMHKRILYLWARIDQAATHFDFIIIPVEINEFKEIFEGMDDFDVIVEGLEEHLEYSMNCFQGVWMIE